MVLKESCSCQSASCRTSVSHLLAHLHMHPAVTMTHRTHTTAHWVSNAKYGTSYGLHKFLLQSFRRDGFTSFAGLQDRKAVR